MRLRLRRVHIDDDVLVEEWRLVLFHRRQKLVLRALLSLCVFLLDRALTLDQLTHAVGLRLF